MASILVEKIVRERLDAYEDEYDVWKADHAQAMLYFNFCDLLEEGVRLFNSICRLDENWRGDVAKKRTEYDEDTHSKIFDLFRRWAKIGRRIDEQLLPWFVQEYGGDVKSSKEFLACYREVQGILAKDEDFFNGESLSALRDQAIDEFRKGETLEFSGQGQ